VTHVRFNLNTPRALAACLTALAGSVLATSAHAAGAETPANEAPSVAVRYDDLDLASEQGALALYRRLEAAARRVCPLEDTRDLGGFMRSRACQSEALARAVRTVNNPQLAAVQALRSSRS
jgi:UrcA family protein